MQITANPKTIEDEESKPSSDKFVTVRIPGELLDRRPDGGRVAYRVRVVLDEIPYDDEPKEFQLATAVVSSNGVQMEEEDSETLGLEKALEQMEADFERGLIEWSPSAKHGDFKKCRLSWKDVKMSLLEPSTADPNKSNLQMIMAMQNGGVLFGVDDEMMFLAADRGPGLVVVEGKRILTNVQARQKSAGYSETYRVIHGLKPTGYEMFPVEDKEDLFDDGLPFEVAAYMEVTGEHFCPPGTYAYLDVGSCLPDHAQ
jgi:hypothetical protein